MAHSPIHFFFNFHFPPELQNCDDNILPFRKKVDNTNKQTVAEPSAVNDTYVFLKAECLDELYLVASDAKKEYCKQCSC